MRPQRVLTAAGLTLSVVAGAFIGTTTAQETSSAPAAECTVNADGARSPRELWQRLSRQAEVVAPNRLRASTDATSSSRHRSSPQRPATELPPQQFVARNFIDTEIFGKMQKDRIRWTGRSSDEEFLRRVFLDLTGQIPTADKARQFLADSSSDKRDRLIEELLASEEYADRWSLWFGDHVQNTQRADNIVIGPLGRDMFYNWMREAFRSDKPYDALVREIVSARGSQYTVGPANYWVRQIQTNGPVQDTFDNLSARTGERFLGIPLECLSCHSGVGHLEAVNSSLVRRSRTDFWKNAAFFASDTHRIVRGANNSIEWIVEANPVPSRAQYLLNTNSGNKTARQPGVDGLTSVAPAFFLSGEQPAAGEPRREAYGRILTAHPQFARATVNFIWKEIFGLGIVEPEDSFDLLRQDPATLAPGATLQPTHPVLLTKLAEQFSSSGYSMKSLLRTIVQSNAYQLSSYYTEGEWNDLWTPYYARHYPRRILAESVVDAIIRATNVTATMTVQNVAIQRAMMSPDPTEPRASFTTFMNGFGRGDRDSTPRSREGSIVQALGMLNDAFVTTRVRNAGNTTVARVLAATRDPGTIADELYIATLSRRPTAEERAAAVTHLRSGEIVRKTEDLQYALLNRLQFLYN